MKIEEFNPPKPRNFMLEVTEAELKVIRFAIGAMNEVKNPGNHSVFVTLNDYMRSNGLLSDHQF